MRTTLKRLLVAGAVVVSTTVLVAAPSDAAKSSAVPACADIIGSPSKTMTWAPGGLAPATVTLQIYLAAPACPDVTYTVTADNMDTPGATAVDNAPTGDGTESNPLTFEMTINDADNCVRLSMTTTGVTKKGSVTYDTAPDGDAAVGDVSSPYFDNPSLGLGCGDSGGNGGWA